MLAYQQTASTATGHHSLIDRVLQLRQQLGIDTPLAISDLEDTSSSPERIHDRRNWLVWSQSPGGGNRPEQD